MTFTKSSVLGFVTGFSAAIAVSMIRVPKRRLAAKAVTTISPSPEEGVILPYSMIHDLVSKGLNAGGMELTVKENEDDVLDPQFVIKFVGMKERE